MTQLLPLILEKCPLFKSGWNRILCMDGTRNRNGLMAMIGGLMLNSAESSLGTGTSFGAIFVHDFYCNSWNWWHRNGVWNQGS